MAERRRSRPQEPVPFDLKLFASAQHHYEDYGYALRPVPWIVSEEAYRITAPAGVPDTFWTRYGYLPASAEQSFLELMLEGEDIGSAQAFTPAYRDEGAGHDDLHVPAFAKLELIDTDGNGGQDQLHYMLRAATDFFERYLRVQVDRTDEGFDIVSAEDGIELGSYGIRTFRPAGLPEGARGLKWVYGTGLAEPRLSTAIERAHRPRPR